MEREDTIFLSYYKKDIKKRGSSKVIRKRERSKDGWAGGD